MTDETISQVCNFEFLYCPIHSLCMYAGAYSVGAKMLIKDYNRKKRKGGKMDYKWLGPYTIVKSLGKGLYALKAADDSVGVINRVHGTRL